MVSGKRSFYTSRCILKLVRQSEKSVQPLSAFSDRLLNVASVVIQALETNGIKFVSFDKGGKLGGDIVEEFQQDETITVFLLHAERERYVTTSLPALQCRAIATFGVGILIG